MFVRLLALPLLGLCLLPLPAAAQFGRSAPRPTAEPARPPPPPALPGLQGRVAPEPIPADPNVSLPPNAALFDAINRGDIAAARDAVARGADTEARNVLGLTPLDAAVDQGRTEIMFYLLSVRSAPRPAPEPPPAAAATPVRPPPPPPRRATAPAPVATPAAPAGPRLWANDGGSPIPAIGFLGFDAGRASAAPESGRPRRG